MALNRIGAKLITATSVLVAAVGACFWWQASARAPDVEQVAVVNGVGVRRRDFVDELHARFPDASGNFTAAQRRQVLDDLIAEELWVQHGLSLHLLERDEAVRDALVDATRGHVTAAILASPINDQDLRDWHTNHLARYVTEGEISVEDFVLPGTDASEGPRILASLSKGVSPGNLGLVRTRRTDGEREFYFAARIHLGDALFAAASQAGDGEYAGPVRLADGLHFLRVIANDKPRPLPFAEVKAQVLNDIQHDRRDRELLRTGQDLHRSAHIEITGDL